MDTLDAARRQIASGEREAARRTLVNLLRRHPRHVPAWMLLATVLDDPQRQADCYRQVLSLDPGNQRAARALAQRSASMGGEILRCPQCGGAMDVVVVGELRDKRARCSYCDTEVDLPDSFRRVQRTQTSERRDGVRRREDTLTLESRTDVSTASSLAEDIAQLIQAQDHEDVGVRELAERLGAHHIFTREDLQGLLTQHDIAIPDEALDDIMRHFTFTEREGGSTKRVVVRRIETRRALGDAFSPDTTERQGCLSLLLRLFGESRLVLERSRPSPPAETSVRTILKAAGEPLPPDERRRCPQCGANLSEHATRCVWCGVSLDQNGP